MAGKLKTCCFFFKVLLHTPSPCLFPAAKKRFYQAATTPQLRAKPKKEKSELFRSPKTGARGSITSPQADPAAAGPAIPTLPLLRHSTQHPYFLGLSHRTEVWCLFGTAGIAAGVWRKARGGGVGGTCCLGMKMLSSCALHSAVTLQGAPSRRGPLRAGRGPGRNNTRACCCRFVWGWRK